METKISPTQLILNLSEKELKPINKVSKSLYPTYPGKLSSAEWEYKSLEIFNRDKFSCRLCGDTKVILYAYTIDKHSQDIGWQSNADNFITYCQHCCSIVGFFKEYSATPINITKKYNLEKNYCTSTSVLTQDGLGLIIGICRHYINGGFEKVFVIKRESLLSYEKIFQDAEKLITKNHGRK